MISSTLTNPPSAEALHLPESKETIVESNIANSDEIPMESPNHEPEER